MDQWISQLRPSLRFRSLLLRTTALRLVAPIDRYAVQWGLRSVRGLASSQSKRVEMVVWLFLLTVMCV